MNVSSITTSSIAATNRTRAVSTADGPPEALDRAAPAGFGGARLSKLGELMQQLQDLSESDPTKAKEVLSHIASQMADQAGATGDRKLAELSDKFAAAAQSGELGGLGGFAADRPPPRPADTLASEARVTGQLEVYRRGESDPMAAIEYIIAGALSS